MNYENMYYEDYDGQSTEGFDLIGVIGKEPIPLNNPEEQVKEFVRLYGDCIIRIYKKDEAVNALG